MRVLIMLLYLPTIYYVVSTHRDVTVLLILHLCSVLSSTFSQSMLDVALITLCDDLEIELRIGQWYVLGGWFLLFLCFIRVVCALARLRCVLLFILTSLLFHFCVGMFAQFCLLVCLLIVLSVYLYTFVRSRVVLLFFVVSAAFMPLAGKLGDKYSKNRVILCFLQPVFFNLF